MAGLDLDELIPCLDAISASQDVEELRSHIMCGVGLAGISRVYFLAPLTADPRIGRVVTNIGLPGVWERHYRKRLYLCDPLPDFAQTLHAAFFWPDDVEGLPIDNRQARYMRLSGRYGLIRGIGVACYGPFGRSGFLGCAWERSGRPGKQALAIVFLVGQYAFQKYCEMVPQQALVAKLSDRELEVLSWMCEGKSNPVIAQLLGISRSSVDVYVRRLFAKLEVTDRTAACVKAFSVGLTVSGEYQQHMRDMAARPDISQAEPG